MKDKKCQMCGSGERWYKTSDELPPYGMDVLLVAKGFEVEKGFLVAELHGSPDEEYFWSIYGGKYWVELYYFTHWMIIPKDPEFD